LLHLSGPRPGRRLRKGRPPMWAAAVGGTARTGACRPAPPIKRARPRYTRRG